MAITGFRPITGAGTNPDHPEWGMAGGQFLRLGGTHYGDGISTPAGADRPGAREISNAVHAQTGSIQNSSGVSDLFWVWGQFIDHDLDLVADATGPDPFNIPVPTGDPYFDPLSTGTQTISLTRSGYDPATGPGTDDPRAQINTLTPFIDASMVYGVDEARANFLRGEGGKLKVSDGDYLPLNDGTFPNGGPNGATDPMAGDVRAGENVALLSMQTIFMREHNRLVDEIAAEHPEYDADRLYQEAKRIVEAEIQVITYKEFLPLLIGADAIPAYSGFHPDVDPQIANIFATAAFRLGHTLLSASLLRIDENGDESAYGSIALRDAFFNPAAMTGEGGVDPLLRGLAANIAQELDPYIVDDVRNFLFGPPGAGGFDLASLNIQRGRDHGLPSYNEARIAYGLAAVTSFADITTDLAIQAKLASVYGTVDQIDVFVGGLAEDHAAGAMVGALFQAILADQFTRIRDGDPYWYENRFEGEELQEIESVTLSDVILRNSDIEYLQHEALIAHDRIGGTDGNDFLVGDDGPDLIIGFAGNDTIDGGQGNDEIYGGDGGDNVSGGAGDDYIDGEDGSDKIDGGQGNDEIYGGNGSDDLAGGAGDDYIEGGIGSDMIRGDAGNDTLIGGSGRDMIMGGSGDDLISGGRGHDFLYGGGGGDIYRYDDPSDFGDMILMFNPKTDHIDLSGLQGASADNIRVECRMFFGQVIMENDNGSETTIARFFTMSGPRAFDDESADFLIFA